MQFGRSVSSSEREIPNDTVTELWFCRISSGFLSLYSCQVHPLYSDIIFFKQTNFLLLVALFAGQQQSSDGVQLVHQQHLDRHLVVQIKAALLVG